MSLPAALQLHSFVAFLKCCLVERAGVARHVTTCDAVETVLLAWTLTGHIFFSLFRVGVCLTCALAAVAVALPAVRGYKIERAAVPKNLFVNPDAVWNNAKTYFKGGAPLIVGCVPGVVRAVVALLSQSLAPWLARPSSAFAKTLPTTCSVLHTTWWSWAFTVWRGKR